MTKEELKLELHYSKIETKIIVEILKDALEVSEQMFESKEQTQAWIIGYMQGAIKSVINQTQIAI